MGILSPTPGSPDGYFTVGKKQPKAEPAITHEAIPDELDVYHSCDHCGHSLDNQPLARAKYRVEIQGQALYFCGNHFRRHSGHFFERGYRVRELRYTVPVKSDPVYL